MKCVRFSNKEIPERDELLHVERLDFIIMSMQTVIGEIGR